MAKQVHADPLFDALLAKDREVFFKLLFERYSKAVLGMAWKYQGVSAQRSDCEDIQMDVFLRLMAHDLEFYDPEHFPKIRGLIRMTTLFVVQNFRKKRARQVCEIDATEKKDLKSDWRTDQQMEYSDYMNHLLDHLHPVKQKVFNDRLHGYNHEEIAEDLGISAEASRFHFSSARKQLRKVINEDGP